MAQQDTNKNKGPVPLFSSQKEKQPVGPKAFVPPPKSIGPSAPPAPVQQVRHPQPPFKPGPKDFAPSKLNAAPAVAKQKIAHQPPTAGRVLFADKAVGTDVDDPFYRDHPLCKKLSQKDIGRVRNIVMAAKIEDTSYVLNYADELRVRFGTLIDSIIKEQTSGKTAAINDKIQDLVIVLDGAKQLTDIVNRPPTKDSGLMRWIKQGAHVPSVDEVTRRFQKFLDQVNQLVVELDSSVSELISLIDSFDTVFKNNQDNFTMLNMHVIAGRIIVEKHMLVTIPQMERQLDPSDIFQGQNVSYFKDCVQRFVRKVDELEKLAHSVTLNAPAIRMLQMSSKDKADRIQRIAQFVVPSWKQQCTVLISALQHADAIDLADIAEDASFQRKKAVIADIDQSYTVFKSLLT